MIGKRPKRVEISSKYQWDLSKLYNSIDEWEKDFIKINSLLENLIEHKGKVMDSSYTLLSVLVKYETLSRLLNNLYVYANMRYHEDTLNEQFINLKGRIEKLYTEINEQTIFVHTEILRSEYSLVKEYINKEKDLKLYEFKLEMIFKEKPYLLSDNEEQIIASMGELLVSSSDIYNVISNSDIRYGTIIIDNNEIEITNSSYIKLLKQDNQEIRKQVFKILYKSHDYLKNTFSSTLKHNVKSLSLIARLKKYKNPLEMSLYNNHLDINIYYNLIDAINSNINVLHKYVNLRKKALALTEMHMYDMYIDLSKETNKEYSYEEAIDIIKKALQPLGEDYVALIDRAYHEKWVDVFDNENKRSGAYSWGTYDSNPYILLNYDKTLNDIFTLAHELGHSLHSYYTNQNQPYTYSGHTIFTAEVASTVNEILLCKYLFDKSTNTIEKKLILNQLMEKFKGTLYRQTMFAEFEKTLYEKEQNNEVLTEKVISDLYYSLNKKYYGNDVIHDEEISLEWTRIYHFYQPFYVFQYATGISIAVIVAYAIYNGDKIMLNNYKSFLASGISDYPLNLLNKIGINMLDKTSIEKAIKIFSDTVDLYTELK